MMNGNLMGVGLLMLVVIGLLSIGFIAAVLFMNRRSKAFRKRHSIPDILGKWACQWFDDDASLDSPKVEDTIYIRQWLRENEFQAVGIQPQFHLTYPITGEVDPSRTVTLEYRAAKYPYEPNRGIACMVLSRDGKKMEGKWFGRRFTGGIGGGHVICLRIQQEMNLT